jgi:hypothetical protein
VGSGSDDLARITIPDEFAADEIRAALMSTRRAAEAQFALAYDLITRLPAVHAAMNAGLVDEPRARVLSEWTTELSGEQARAVCNAMLARVSKLTTGQLIERIKKMAIAIDPVWAAALRTSGVRAQGDWVPQYGRFGESFRVQPALWVPNWSSMVGTCGVAERTIRAE